MAHGRKSDYFSIRLEPEDREFIKELALKTAMAEGRMISDGEMVRILIREARSRNLATEKAPAPRSSKRALGVEKLTKESGR